MLKQKYYLSTIAMDAQEIAEHFGLGLEIAEYCTARNMDERYDVTHAELTEKLREIS